jgi:hypothetical protein
MLTEYFDEPSNRYKLLLSSPTTLAQTKQGDPGAYLSDMADQIQLLVGDFLSDENGTLEAIANYLSSETSVLGSTLQSY